MIIPALQGVARRLDNENSLLRAALEKLAEDAIRAVEGANALDLDDEVAAALSTVLEHGSHAWHALTGEVDGPWPPETANYPAGSIAYHLAAMLKYTKELYDKRAG